MAILCRGRLILILASVFVSVPVAAVGLQHLRSRHTRSRDLPSASSSPVCELPVANGAGDPLQVYVNDHNARYVVFANDGLDEQTKVQCQGDVPVACGPNSNSTRNCEEVSCACNKTGETQFAYVKKMMEQITPECNGKLNGNDGYQALVIGLGGGSIPEQILAACPDGTRVETIEYDQRFLDAATRFFGFNLETGRNEVHIGEGGEAVRARALNGQKYDVVVIDAFSSGLKVPDSCSSEDFVKNLKTVLRTDGMAIQNILSPQYEKVIKSYQTVFGEDNVEGEDVQLHFSHLIVASIPQGNPFGPK